jgi:hypothetical protein
MKNGLLKLCLIGFVEIAGILALFHYLGITDTSKKPLASLYSESVDMEYRGSLENPVVAKIVAADPFRRFHSTRGLGVKKPGRILFLFPGTSGENEIWYYDKMMVEAGKKGLASLLVDFLDVPFFVDSETMRGRSLSSTERKKEFLAALFEYVKGLGFNDAAVWAFSSGAQDALAFCGSTEGYTKAYVDFFGTWSVAGFPPLSQKALFLLGARDPAAFERTAFAAAGGKEAFRIAVFRDAGQWLTKRDGSPDAGAWKAAVGDAIDFSSK